MKNRRTLGVAVVLLVTGMLATPVFSGMRDVFVSGDALFNGTEIPKGKYQLTWKKNGSDDTVELRLYQGTRKIATAKGHFVENGVEREGDSIAYKINEKGQREIAEVRFGGKSRAIEIDS